ncbi:MAG: L-dopachrome tautomerase-related protein [Phycisphaerae bacterium]|nr:L-dopachrome tautomerase-related protein [Phycisphaerae bacterium]
MLVMPTGQPATFRIATKRLSAVAVILAIASAAPSYSQHGGVPPDRKPPPIARQDRPAAEGLELVRGFDETPGNVAITPEGRVFMSMHPFGNPKARVIEVLAEGGTRPYPTPTWSSAVGANGVGIQSIIGIKSDAEGVLWMLDAGNLNEPGGSPPKLVAWDTKVDRLVRVIHLPPPASRASSFLQDFVIDAAHDAIYIADSGIGAGFEKTTPAIVVVYLKTGVSRRILENAECVRGDLSGTMTIDGKQLQVAGADGKLMAPVVGINPIALDGKGEWVYFGAMHGTTMWKVRAADLANPGLNNEAFVERIEKAGPKPPSDGIAVDTADNIYVTDVMKHAIGVLEANGTYRVLIQDPRLQWPDGITAGPDGHFYVVANQLNRHAALNGGVDEMKAPFVLLRFKPLAPAIVGR